MSVCVFGVKFFDPDWVVLCVYMRKLFKFFIFFSFQKGIISLLFFSVKIKLFFSLPKYYCIHERVTEPKNHVDDDGIGADKIITASFLLLLLTWQIMTPVATRKLEREREWKSLMYMIEKMMKRKKGWLHTIYLVFSVFNMNPISFRFKSAIHSSHPISYLSWFSRQFM